MRQVFEQTEFNPILRIKKPGNAEEKRAYHPRALLELLVNHFVHRDYTLEEPCEIHIQPGKGILFNTSGGLPSKVFNQLAPDSEGRFRPKRGVREQRNPLLADIFYGLQVMDREGSGLVDVEKFAVEHEGNCDFRVGNNNASVSMTLYQAESDPDGLGRTARGLPEKAIFIANLFRFQKLPSKVFITPLGAAFASRQTKFTDVGLEFDRIPCFHCHGGAIITFEDMTPYEEHPAGRTC